MTIEEAHAEVKYGWEQAYSPEALAQAVDVAQRPASWLSHQHLPRAALLPRDLFPHDGENGVAKGCRAKPPNHS
jgi:hypothetical protein